MLMCAWRPRVIPRNPQSLPDLARPLTRKIPLRQPGPAALDLRSFWIERIEYEEADEAPEQPPESTVRLSRPVLHQNETDTDTYLMTLRIRVSQEDLRSIDLTMCGVFQVQVDDANETTSHQMLIYNGSAMLYGAARGIIESVTGLTGLGRLRVPTVNVATVLRGR